MATEKIKIIPNLYSFQQGMDRCIKVDGVIINIKKKWFSKKNLSTTN